MTIRAWREADARAVRALLAADADPLWMLQGHAMHGSPRDGERWRRSFVAEREGHVVGAMTLGRNFVHPGRYNCAVDVGPEFRRRGIGTELLEFARSVRPEPVPLASKMRESDPAAGGLLAHFAGSTYARSPCPVIDPTDPQVRAWCARHTAPVVSLMGCDRAELVTAYMDLYRWMHERWSPVGSETALAEMSGLMIDELDRRVSSGVHRDGRLIAVAFAFGDGAGVEVVAETMRRDEPDGQAALGAAIAAVLAAADRAGVRRVEFDGHDADPHLAPLMATLHTRSTNPLLLVGID